MNSDAFRFRSGDFSCMAIKDAAAQYPMEMFLLNLAKEHYEPGPIELPYTCLFIDTGRDRVLVDTGIGGKLLSLLHGEGIESGQVNIAVLSHAHPDHIGGCLNDAGKPAFPNARYVMLQKEWDYWMSNPRLQELPLDEGFRQMMLTSAQKNLRGIEKQLDVINPDTEIVPGITAVAAFGHSPGQMGLQISSAGQRLVFVADAIVLPLHLEHPDSIGATDHRPDEVVATRMNILKKAEEEKSLVSTSHFAFPGLGYVSAKGGAWHWHAGVDRAETSEVGSSD
jgi:glyoxylase-like metal-dependent hydrolase (beta-lactamase superfamily II)